MILKRKRRTMVTPISDRMPKKVRISSYGKQDSLSSDCLVTLVISSIYNLGYVSEREEMGSWGYLLILELIVCLFFLSLLSLSDSFLSYHSIRKRLATLFSFSRLFHSNLIIFPHTISYIQFSWSGWWIDSSFEGTMGKKKKGLL